MVRCSIAARDADAGKGGAGLPPDRDGGHKQSERRTHSARASARALVVRSVRNTRSAAGHFQVEPHHLHSIQVGAGGAASGFGDWPSGRAQSEGAQSSDLEHVSILRVQRMI